MFAFFHSAMFKQKYAPYPSSIVAIILTLRDRTTLRGGNGAVPGVSCWPLCHLMACAVRRSRRFFHCRWLLQTCHNVPRMTMQKREVAMMKRTEKINNFYECLRQWMELDIQFPSWSWSQFLNKNKRRWIQPTTVCCSGVRWLFNQTRSNWKDNLL